MRSRNTIIDWTRKYAKYISLKARRINAGIVIEDLENLWNNISHRNNSTIVWKLSRFAYRKLLCAIITKCIEYNVPVIMVHPKGTSSKCPRCGTKLTYNHRLALCLKCRFMADRDKIGVLNIYSCAFKGMRGSHGSPLSAPAMKDETRQSGRTLDEPMTSHEQV